MSQSKTIAVSKISIVAPAAKTTSHTGAPSTKDAGRVQVGGVGMRFKDAGRVKVGGVGMRF
jgi:hypothetical protein